MRRLRSNRGQAMVEFALVLPVVLVAAFAAVQFGQFYATYNTMTDATRAAARVASFCKTSTQSPSSAGTNAASGVSGASFAFNPPAAANSSCGLSSGTSITVTGTASSQTIRLPFVSFTLTPTSTETVVEE